MRRISTTFLAISAAVTMASCIPVPLPPDLVAGSNPSEGGAVGSALQGAQGESYFIANVYPELTKSCSLCHITSALGAPRFLSGATPRDAYANVRAYRDGVFIAPPSTNLFLNKGKHEGPDLNGVQFGVVKRWVLLESPEEDVTPPQSFFDTLLNFASCMNFEQFQAEKLDQIALLPVRAGGKVCADCHSDPKKTGNLLLNKNAQQTFAGLKVFPGVLKLVSAVVSETGSFKELEPSERLRLKGTEFNNCSADVAINLGFNVQDPRYCHPDYDFPQELQDALRFYVNNTLTASREGLCQNQK